MSAPETIAPRLSQDEAWAALRKERRWPAQPGAVELREARLLLAPFWRRHASGSESTLVSAADLLPIGLPPLGPLRSRLAGLVLNGAAPDPGAAAPAGAILVDQTLPPPGDGWFLQRRPVWAFHYVQHNKERLHVVDAVTGRALGPARRPRVVMIACAGAIGFLLGFGITWPLLGPAAALPAWLLALGGTRLTMMKARADF